MKAILTAVIICLLIVTIHSADNACPENSNCFDCLRDNSTCIWCSQTRTCVSNTQQCQNNHIVLIGTLGEYANRNMTCSAYIEQQDFCLDESRAVYFRYASGNTYNFKEGGLSEQPILKLDYVLLNHVVESSIRLTLNSSSREISLFTKDIIERSKLSLGAYMIGNFSESQYYVTPFLSSNFPDLTMAYHKDRNVNGTLAGYINPSGLTVWAPPGVYHYGVVLQFQHSNNESNTCVFLPSPQSIRIFTVYHNLFLALFMYCGIPLYCTVVFILLLFSMFCPFSGAPNYQKRGRFSRVLDILQKVGRQHARGHEMHIHEEDRVFDAFWLFRVNSDKIIEQNGFRAYYQWKFARRMVLLSVSLGIFTLLMLLPIYLTSKGGDPYYMDFAITTVATVLKGKRKYIATAITYIIYLACVTVMTLLSVKLVFFKKRHLSAVYTGILTDLPPLELKVDIEDHTGKPYIVNFEEVEQREKLIEDHFNSLQSVVSFSPTQTDNADIPDLERDLISESNEMAESPVIKSHVIADISPVVEELEKIYHFERIEDRNGKEQNELMNSYEQVLRTFDKTPLITTQAFVTFRTIGMVDYFINRSKDSMFKLKRVDIEPEDIMWQNFFTSKLNVVVRRVIMIIIYLVMLSVALLIIILFTYAQGNYFISWLLNESNSALYQTELASASQSLFFGLTLGEPAFLAIVTEAMSSFSRWLIEAVLTRREKIRTVARFEASLFLKTGILMVFPTLLIPVVADIAGLTVSPIAFFSNISMRMIHLILSQAFVSKGLNLLTDVLTVCWRYLRSGGKPRRPKFDYINSYAKSSIVFSILILIGPICPLIWVAGIIYFSLSYIVDTMLIAFFYERSRGSGHRIFAYSTSFIQIAVIIGVCGIIFLLDFNVLVTSLIIFTAVGISLLTLVIGYVSVRIYHKSKLSQTRITDEQSLAARYAQPHLHILLRSDIFQQQQELELEVNPQIN